jgi:outer membrane protein assembly factor BamA
MKNLLTILLILCFSTAFAQQESDCFVVSKISLKGNKVTKLSTIQREMLFHEGDTICDMEVVKQSRENLLNTSLFNFVDFDWVDDGPRAKQLTISMVERWYLWPIPYLAYADRNLRSWFEANDITRLSYGFDLVYGNMWGLKHELDLTIIAGYNQNYGVSYDIPYLTKRQRLGVKSTIGYTRDREVAYITQNDKVTYFKGDSEYAHESFYASLEPYYRFGYRNTLYLQLTYDNRSFNDSLQKLNSDFANPEGTRFQYFTLSAMFKNDYRDDHNYPLDGHYLEFELTKIGLGLFDYAPNLFYGKLTADWYTPVIGRFYWASNLTAKLSDSNKAPYFLSQGLGYRNDYVRTFDLYVVDALNYAIIKNNLKFAILEPVTGHLPLIKNDRFGKIHLALYANLFFDCAYTWNVPIPDGFSTRIANEFIYGTGVGIDLVTYYDKVFRFEYGINSLGETGFFVHLVAPI